MSNPAGPVGINVHRGGEAAGMPILTDTLTRNAVHIGGRQIHRRNAQFLVAMNKKRAIFNVHLTLAALRTALFAMQKIIENRVPILFFEPRGEYGPAVKRLSTSWRQLYAVGGWPGGILTNKTQLYGNKSKFSNMTAKGFYPAAAFMFTTRGMLANTAINECRLLEIPIFGIVNTAVHQPAISYPIPANDISGSSFNLIMGAMQGMMVRADVLEKRRLFQMILTQARIHRQLREDVQERMMDKGKKEFSERDSEDDSSEERRLY